jgi:hypothetical protein
MKTQENKTKDYILRATKNYQDKFDRIVVLAPMGTKDRIKAVAGGASVTSFINAAIEKELARMEKDQGEKI